MHEALSQMISLYGLSLIISGTILGIFVGAIPGLTGTMTIALVLPLTYGCDPLLSMAFLISIYVGAVSGGMITATLLRMPGTPASIITTLDGYPMAQKGQPDRALGLGVMASFVGGLLSWGFLVALTKPIAILSSKFAYFEYFSLVMMALVLIATLGGRSLSRSLFSGFLGILLAMPGINAATGEARLTFGFTDLNDGLKLLPVLIGLFAVNQILQDIRDIQRQGEPIKLDREGVAVRFTDLFKHGVNLLRSSVIGTWIGILPGIGANIGSVSAYSAAKSLSKDPEQFGTGCEDGMVYTIMAAMFIANIVMAIVMLFSMRHLAKVTQVPRSYLLPVILCFCVVGSFALSNRLFDVWVMIGFGVLGYALERFSIPLAPFIIGFVLGPIAEKNLSLGLQASDGSYLPLVTRPMSLLFLIVAAVMLFLPQLKRAFSNRSRSTQ